MTGPLLRRFRRCRRGATIVEFAFAAPVMLIAMMGVFDLGYNMYTATLLQGAIQKAARDSTIEGAATSSDTLDSRVRGIVHTVAPHATLAFSRKSYTNFTDVSQPEDFTDVDKNGACNDGEPFEDANGNGVWDKDRGRSGVGGARDAVLYEVTVTYQRAFPVAKLIGLPDTTSMTARTVLRNQPYTQQTAITATGNCL